MLALIAAALAAVAFGSGYLVGGRSDDVEAVSVIPMAGVDEGRGASASIELLPQDDVGELADERPCSAGSSRARTEPTTTSCG